MAAMTEVRTLLTELRRRGATVRPDGDSFVVNCPPGTVTPDLEDRLRAAKNDIATHLRERPVWPCSSCKRFAFAEPDVRCFWCRRPEPTDAFGP